LRGFRELEIGELKDWELGNWSMTFQQGRQAALNPLTQNH